MNNPQAFPVFPYSVDMKVQEPGMTLRDYFAAKAMQSMMQTGYQSHEIPSGAYAWADAMLKERAK
jgi:hypothetical protein